MKRKFRRRRKLARHLAAGALALGATCATSQAQYAPPPPPTPFQGFINEALRQNDPYMNQWDFGGSLRVRYEMKDNFAIPVPPGAPTHLDFRAHGADEDLSYFLERLRFRAGYNDEWFSMLAEGRSSMAQNDQRFAYAN